MSSASYGPGLRKKELVCVEVNSTHTQTGTYIPSGPLSIQGVFTNTVNQTVSATVTVAAGGSITPGGTNFTLAGASNNYLVTVSFNRKFSGAINFIATSLDNNIGGTDKICNATIGNPDVLNSPELELLGNCLQATVNSNPATPRNFGWSEVDEITTFSFTFQRNNIGSSVVLQLLLVEKAYQKWEINTDTTPYSYVDPLTNTFYASLPANVFVVNCEENQRLADYTENLCYKVGNQISYDISGIPLEAWDAYNGQRPRTDGVPPLNLAIPGFTFGEFSPDGRQLYHINGGSFVTNNYNGFTLSGANTVAINFLGFPAAAGYIPVGLAVHPITKVIYAMYMDGARRLYLGYFTITSTTVTLQFIGDTQFNSVLSIPVDAHDITFSSSGQLLMAHGTNLYLVDHITGIINPNTIPVTISTTGILAIRSISRFNNGDLHISGSHTVLGNVVVIYDGESYSLIRQWSGANSTTPPDSNLSIAYPVSPEVKFKRLYIKNLETNSLTFDDRDLISGAPIFIPSQAMVVNCTDTTPKEVSWTEDLCYVIDKNVISQGTVEIVGGQIVSDATGCTQVGGFVPPAPVTYSSITHDNAGLQLYALNAGGNLLDTYNWATINAPVLSTSVAITGYIGGAEAEKSLRTRWSDNTLWLMTEEVVGINRTFRFYIVNKTTAVLTLQGAVTYPSGGTNNGHFAWGVDDTLYFSYGVGGTNYRVSKLSKVSYNILDTVLNVNYVIDNINTDLPNQRLILTKAATTGLDYYSYSGAFISTCGTNTYADAIQAPLGTFQVGDTTTRIKRVFTKDLVTGDVNSYYHSYETGEDISLPSLVRFVSCDTSIKSIAARNPRFRVLTGITTWQKSISAPNAKSVTVTRLANNITISDGVNGPQAINTVASFTWSADDLLGNDIIVSGTAAGSSFAVSYLT